MRLCWGSTCILQNEPKFISFWVTLTGSVLHEMPHNDVVDGALVEYIEPATAADKANLASIAIFVNQPCLPSHLFAASAPQ